MISLRRFSVVVLKPASGWPLAATRVCGFIARRHLLPQGACFQREIEKKGKTSPGSTQLRMRKRSAVIFVLCLRLPMFIVLNY